MRFLGDDWFRQPLNQAAVVAYANTRAGRVQLGITGDIPRGRSVVAVHRNRVEWLADQKLPGMVGALSQVAAAKIIGAPMRRVMDVRCRSQFADRLAGLLWRDSLQSSLLRAMWSWERHGVRIPGISPRFAFADTDTSWPDPDAEITSVDGWCGMAANGSWASVQGGAGDTVQDTNGSDQGLQLDSHTTTDEYSLLKRTLLVFDTSGMAGGAVDSSVLSIHVASKQDFTGFAIGINVYSSAPASNTGLVAGDYDSCGTTAFSTSKTYAGVSTGAYNAFTLNATGEAAIDVAGVSKFSLRDPVYDAPNSEPTWNSDGLDFNYFSLKFAETAGTGSDPKLVTEYTAGGPPAGLALLLLGAG